MRYCVFCGHQVDINEDTCPFCFEDISEGTTEKLYHANINCINCNSDNVEYSIKRKNKHGIVYEEEVYTCKECGKVFNDKNRLGGSFNNSPQIILSKGQKKLATFSFIVLTIVVIVALYNHNKIVEENSWIKLDCAGMKTMTFKKIKDGAPYDDDKYIGNSYIFQTTIEKIDNNEITTPIEKGDYSGSYIKVNREELKKLSTYKKGDTIKFCGTVKKISTYHKVYVENATIIDH